MFKTIFQTTEDGALTVIEKIGTYFNTILCFKDKSPIFFHVEIWLPVYFEDYIIESMLAENNVFFQNLTLEPLYDATWFTYENRLISPIHVGQFFIPSFYSKEETPSSLIRLNINSSSAFGNGKHPSTHGCLKLMSDLDQSHIHTTLDFGCGTGILSIAMSFINKNCTIAAIDNDETAISTTQKNVQQHNISNIRILHSDGFEKMGHQKFDLIIANIAAETLIEFCEEFLNHLNACGLCILSGILISQEKMVTDLYKKNRFSIQKKIYTENWVSLLVKKEGLAIL